MAGGQPKVRIVVEATRRLDGHIWSRAAHDGRLHIDLSVHVGVLEVLDGWSLDAALKERHIPSLDVVDRLAKVEEACNRLGAEDTDLH